MSPASLPVADPSRSVRTGLQPRSRRRAMAPRVAGLLWSSLLLALVACGGGGGGGTTAAATPTFTPPAGLYATAQDVVIASATAGAVVHYPTDGATPTAASPAYSAAVHVGAPETISAIAIDTASGFTNSAVATALYTINAAATPAAAPTFNPAAGTYPAAQTVTISSTTSGASIYYTTD